MQHVFHKLLCAANDDDIILLVKQENIQSVEELTLLVLSTDWGRGIVITMGGKPRLLQDVARSRLIQLTCFEKYLQQDTSSNNSIDLESISRKNFQDFQCHCIHPEKLGLPSLTKPKKKTKLLFLIFRTATFLSFKKSSLSLSPVGEQQAKEEKKNTDIHGDINTSVSTMIGSPVFSRSTTKKAKSTSLIVRTITFSLLSSRAHHPHQ